MKLSIIVIFYNMQREAPRTLFSVSPEYQIDTEDIEYEVIAIDNGSTKPLPDNLASSLGKNFRQVFFESKHPSPCEAINSAVRSAKGEYVMCCIDGARILSPGIVSKAVKISELYQHPFTYTLGMHLGDKVQNHSLFDGYNQDAEDKLLATIDWMSNGYELFNISSVALSSKQGFFSDLTESNSITMRRDDYIGMGGFNESFISPGGGICNLDIFNRANEDPKMTPIMLLGEATFHQFHGGVATNVAMSEHPFQQMNKEYRKIYGSDFKSYHRAPVYYGAMPSQALRLISKE